MPDNIIHAPRLARNPHLMKALSVLGLAGQPTPGIEQMTWAMLSEGKEAPVTEELEQGVCVTFSDWAGFDLWPIFIEEETALGRTLNVDHLLLLRMRRMQVHRFMDNVMEAYPEVEAVGQKRWTQYRMRRS